MRKAPLIILTLVVVFISVVVGVLIHRARTPRAISTEAAASNADYRLKQREVQNALYVFDGQVDVNQPLTAQMENTQSTTDWTSVLRRVEQERAAVRSRAARRPDGQKAIEPKGPSDK